MVEDCSVRFETCDHDGKGFKGSDIYICLRWFYIE